ncbi:hypothetical protein, partial [Gluconobacter sphaericus]|uniref:hypothetical protein n=1 Tax=Gluconobacter sphaericus TaxID=574987 RepID=UPI001B8CDC01
AVRNLYILKNPEISTHQITPNFATEPFFVRSSSLVRRTRLVGASFDAPDCSPPTGGLRQDSEEG